ncbi:MAG: hypothetical protein K5770_15395 [Lachnospiraceae bacterium]|nr:hypothetical protein [Lachnospiraceae bacterium]
MNLKRTGTGYFFEWYYILVIFGYISTLATLKIRPGIIAAFLLCLVAAELVYRKMITVQGLIDKLILLYLAYNLLSVIWLRASGMPVNVFFGEFAVSVLPIIFYFAGKGAGTRLSAFYDRFTIAVLIVGILGIIFHIFAPQFYIDYSYNMMFVSKADAATTRVRMDSVVGCTLLAFLGTAAMMTGSYFLSARREDSLAASEHGLPRGGAKTPSDAGEVSFPEHKPDNREIKNTDRVKNRRDIIKAAVYIAVSMIIAILSNQRSALVTVILILVFINYLAFFKLELLPKKYFRAELITLAFAFILLCVVKPDLLLKFWWRLESLPGGISQRSEQWIAAINNMYSTWIGNGLGANGHKALGVEGAHVIADGGLIKLYCEEGIIGFSVFLYILFNACGKALRDLREYYVELGLIGAVILQSIGSNIIAFQLAAPVFWFAIGRINSPGCFSEENDRPDIAVKKAKAEGTA